MHDNVITQSALFFKKGFRIVVCGRPIAMRIKPPKFPKIFAVERSQKVHSYLHHIGLKNGKLTKTMRLGLSNNPDSEECISKFGSTIAAQIAITNIKE